MKILGWLIALSALISSPYAATAKFNNISATAIELSGTGVIVSASGATQTASVTNINGKNVSASTLTAGLVSSAAIYTTSLTGVVIGTQPSYTVLTTSQTWLTPSGTTVNTVFHFVACGGGGGGGGQLSVAGCSGGGGAGVCTEYYGNGVAAGTGVSITIGLGGAGSCNNNGGTNGVSTSLIFNGTTVTAGGGQGGASTFSNFAGGNGGVSSNGIMASRGQSGQHGTLSSPLYSGMGGSCWYGSGGRGISSTTPSGGPGENAVGFCSGGSGGCSGSNNCGGNGTAGLVKIDWLQ